MFINVKTMEGLFQTFTDRNVFSFTIHQFYTFSAPLPSNVHSQNNDQEIPRIGVRGSGAPYVPVHAGGCNRSGVPEAASGGG